MSWVRIQYVHFNLNEFGSTSMKPVHIYSTFAGPLELMETTHELSRSGNRDVLGLRWWDPRTGSWRFNGYKNKMEESSAYPNDFGLQFVSSLISLFQSCRDSNDMSSGCTLLGVLPQEPVQTCCAGLQQACEENLQHCAVGKSHYSESGRRNRGRQR